MIEDIFIRVLVQCINHDGSTKLKTILRNDLPIGEFKLGNLENWSRDEVSNYTH